MKRWYLYILRCGNGNLYTGITLDVKRRLREHRGKEGRGAKALRGKGPLTLVFKARMKDLRTALKTEYRVKQLTRAQKEKIVKAASFGRLSAEH